MSKSLSVSAKIISIDGNLYSIPKPLVNKLIQFTEEHYHIENRASFIDIILRPKHPGEIIFFYGEADELVGYTRIYLQHIDMKGKSFIVYSSNSYNDHKHNTHFVGARLGLTQTMKYKLSHPDKELVHFSCVSSPREYLFLAHLCETIYPRPDREVPKQIIKLLDVLKKNNNWPSLSDHPMLIGGQLVQKQREASELNASDESLIRYFLSLNPDYAAGDGLLVCIPLSLNNIGHSIKQLLTQAPQEQTEQRLKVYMNPA